MLKAGVCEGPLETTAQIVEHGGEMTGSLCKSCS